MATLLIIVIYTAFIGLGIPDSLFGPAWPVMHLEFGLDSSIAGYITPACSLFTIIASLMSARVINRFGTAKVTAVSTLMTALALFFYSFSPNIWVILLMSVPLGLGGGAIDAGLNNYVALHFNTATMSYLHCFYGVGVSISPYFMSIALDTTGSWRDGYRLASVVQIGIALLVICTLPIWKRVKTERTFAAQTEAKTLTLMQTLRVAGVWKTSLIFVTSCAIEYICGVWGSTFLVESKGMDPADAAKVITFYYLGMTLGRLLSGLISHKFTSWRIILMGQVLVGAAVVLLLLPLPAIAASVALFMVGLGNGPLYPNLVHLTPYNFGADISQSVMGTQMAATSTGIMLMPMLFGALVSFFTADVFSVYIAILFVLMVVLTVSMFRFAKKNGRMEERENAR